MTIPPSLGIVFLPGRHMAMRRIFALNLGMEGGMPGVVGCTLTNIVAMDPGIGYWVGISVLS